MLVHEIAGLVKILDPEYPPVLLVCQVDFILHALQNCQVALQKFFLHISGGECERRGIRVRLGGNSYPISAMPDVHHCYS